MQVSTATEPQDRGVAPRPPDDDQSPQLKYLALGVVALLAVVGLFALFGGSSNEPQRPADTASLPYMDGTLTVVEQDRLVMRPFQGGREVAFTIKPADQANFDIAHLQSHSSVAIPTRIYFRDEGGTKFAVYKEDAPVNSQTP